MDDLATLLPTSKATWLLIVAGVTTLAFALSAFASDRLGHTIVSPFLAAGAWLFGALAAFAVVLAIVARLAPNGAKYQECRGRAAVFGLSRNKAKRRRTPIKPIATRFVPDTDIGSHRGLSSP